MALNFYHIVARHGGPMNDAVSVATPDDRVIDIVSFQSLADAGRTVKDLAAAFSGAAETMEKNANLPGAEGDFARHIIKTRARKKLGLNG